MAKMFYQSGPDGEWAITRYGSGTLTVKQRGASDDSPHYAITYTMRHKGNEELRTRIAEELTDWLNGAAPRPARFRGGVHWDADTFALATGHTIEARGPHTNRTSGGKRDVYRQDLHSITARAGMIARLLEEDE